MSFFTEKNVYLNFEAKSKDDFFRKISKIAKEQNLIKSQKDLYEAFLKREEESSTGFENGYAIPHAHSDTIIKPTLLWVTFKKEVDWNSLDGKPTKYAFVILVPNSANNEHIQMLSKISIMMMNQETMDKLVSLKNKKEIAKLINNNLYKEQKESSNISEDNNKLILALTACPVGIAHTYLAAEKLTEAGKELNYNIKVETHGSQGVKNQFTNEEIEKADIILVSADIGLDLSRFKGKRIYQTNIKPSIKDPINTIKTALEKATIQDNSNVSNSDSQKKFKDDGELSSWRKAIQHLQTGVSYMVPFIILGGICIALAVGIGKLIYGENYGAPEGDFFYYLEKIGSIGFTLMIGALGAFIANSIAGRSAIAPTFIVCVLANTADALYPIGGINVETAMGFIGAILFGFLIGYTVKWINTWNVHKNIQALMPIFVIPLGVGLFYSLIAIFVIGAPIGYIMDKFIWALNQAFTSNTNISIGVGLGFGLLFGAMVGFDMGGPINKVAFITGSTLISSGVYEPMGMVAAAIPVAPIGMALCTMIFRNKFNENEKTLGVSAFVMGCIGISEGAIPFAIADPKKAIISNVVGSSIAGGIAGALGVTCLAGHGGPIVGVLAAVSSDRSYGMAGGIGFFFMAIVIGSLITAFMYGFLRKVDQANNFKTSKGFSFKIFSKKTNKIENNEVVKMNG